ncbi:MAG: hypothetical protein ACRC5A_09940 [Enterobacteriaceae bacterium]
MMNCAQRLIVTTLLCASLTGYASAKNFAYVSAYSSVFAYGLSDDSGKVTQVEKVDYPNSIAIHIDSTHSLKTDFLYVTAVDLNSASFDSDVHIYRLDRNSGVMKETLPPPFRLGSFEKMVISPDGKWAYTIGGGTMLKFAINPGTGALTDKKLAGDDLVGSVKDMKFDMSGNYTVLYSAKTGEIASFQNDKQGFLTRISTVKGEFLSDNIAFSDKDGVWVVQEYCPGIGPVMDTYSLDSNDGSLIFLKRTSTNLPPDNYNNIQFTPDGKTLYAAVHTDKGNYIAAWHLNVSDGSLQRDSRADLHDSSVAGISVIGAMAIPQNNHYLYSIYNEATPATEVGLGVFDLQKGEMAEMLKFPGVHAGEGNQILIRHD